jgi:hypothetical protein
MLPTNAAFRQERTPAKPRARWHRVLWHVISFF